MERCPSHILLLQTPDLRFCCELRLLLRHMCGETPCVTLFSIKPGFALKFGVIIFSRNLFKTVRSHGRIRWYSTMDRYVSAGMNASRLNRMTTNLAREGRITEARRLFDRLEEKDVITWTSVISGYVKCGMIEEARRLFDRADAQKNVVTWTSMVGGYIKADDIDEAQRLFNIMPERNPVSWNTMIDGHARNGSIDSALNLFDRMPERNVVSWNTIIAALVNHGRIGEALVLFDSVPEKDVISWTTMIAGLSDHGSVDKARELFDMMPIRNIVSWNAMVTGYAKNSRPAEAFEMFKSMPDRDLPSWNTMVTGFIHNGDLSMARQVFDEMPRKNVVSWTAMIAGYAEFGDGGEALRTFSKMRAGGDIAPNEGTFVTVLTACSDSAGLGEGRQIHQTICKTTHQFHTRVVSALINMYSKCGELDSAGRIFDDGSTACRDLISWNGMIAAYARHGRAGDAILLYERMQESGFRPNDVTYVEVLSACSHAGMVDEGLRLFRRLLGDASVRPREEHYACVVDLYGRAGKLERALELVRGSRMTRSSACVWSALLAGCNAHGNLDVGKVAAERLMEIEPGECSPYMLMCNIFAGRGKWKEATRLRVMMRKRCLKKQPGCSWIETGNRVNVFLAGDKSHFLFHIICSLLCDLHMKMKKRVGFVISSDDIMIHDESRLFL